MQVEKATDNATDTTSYSLFDFDFVRTSTRSTPLAAYAAGPASALTTDGGGVQRDSPKTDRNRSHAQRRHGLVRMVSPDSFCPDSKFTILRVVCGVFPKSPPKRVI